MPGKTRKRRSKKRSRRLRGGNNDNLKRPVIKLLEAFVTNTKRDKNVLDLVKDKIEDKKWFDEQCRKAGELLKKVKDQDGGGRKKQTRNNRRTRKKRGGQGQNLMAFVAARILGVPGLIVFAAAMYCWRKCRDAVEEHRQQNLPPPTAAQRSHEVGAHYADYGY